MITFRHKCLLGMTVRRHFVGDALQDDGAGVDEEMGMLEIIQTLVIVAIIL